MNLLLLIEGRIPVGNYVIDIGKAEIRHKITENNLHDYYDEFTRTIGDYSGIFEDQKAFADTLDTIVKQKPIMESMEARLPSPFNIKFLDEDIKHIEEPHKGYNRQYFMTAGFGVVGKTDILPKIPEALLHEVISHPDAIPVIGVRNDITRPLAKGHLFHEALHYFILTYQAKSNTWFTKGDEFETPELRYQKEFFIQEHVTQFMTDVLLTNDKEALMEKRWSYFQNPYNIGLYVTACLGISFSVAAAFSNPINLVVAAGTYAGTVTLAKLYKNSQKELYTEPIQITDQKI